MAEPSAPTNLVTGDDYMKKRSASSAQKQLIETTLLVFLPGWVEKFSRAFFCIDEERLRWKLEIEIVVYLHFN